MIRSLVYFLAFLNVSVLALNCYDCDNCTVTNGAIEAVCKENEICLTAALNLKDKNATSVNRGCKLQQKDVVNFCDKFIEEVTSDSLEVLYCFACTNDRCNNAEYKPVPKSGSNMIQFNLIVFVLLSCYIYL